MALIDVRIVHAENGAVWALALAAAAIAIALILRRSP